MNREKRIETRLERIQKWTSRFEEALEKALQQCDDDYRLFLKESDEELSRHLEGYRMEEERIKCAIEKAGSEFTKKKYLLEREASGDRSAIKALEDEFAGIRNRFEKETAHLDENRSRTKVSYERQKEALKDLYEEKRRHTLNSKSKLIKEVEQARENVSQTKKRVNAEIESREARNNGRIKQLQDEINAKKKGWELALDTLQREIEALKREKDDVEKRTVAVQTETENELRSVRNSMKIEKDQLEIDKATLIERAEEDTRQCENDVELLKRQVESSEQEVQDCILNKEKRMKEEEEKFQIEEASLKEAVHLESEKRDYEQKLLEQEKSRIEKELSGLKDGYDKKKWYWDNQVRNLLMQKSVQESEFEAEKMKVKRQARTHLKSLEAKRDELKQRLSELKTRHKNLTQHEQKETELRLQRWNWRKERLWTMWKNRLDVLKKERLTLQEALRGIEETLLRERRQNQWVESRENKRVGELQDIILHTASHQQGARQHKEIEFELEKTRVLAQIKECETLIIDWQDRLKNSQAQFEDQSKLFRDQLGFLDKFYQDEEKETDLFLHYLQKVLTALEVKLDSLSASKDAA